MFVDKVPRLVWSGSVATTRAQRFWGIPIRGGRPICCSIKTSLLFSLPSAPRDGHVLWVHPPFSFAFQWDFVQDFLSNTATLWLWVDACQFDLNVCELWLFATSSQGLLPLAPQRNHESHPPPAVCAQFAKLVAPFVSRDSHGFFTLWSDAHRSGLSCRCQALPSFCRQDHLVGTHDVVRGQRWNHCTQDFPSIPLGQQLQGVSFSPHPGNQASQQRSCSGSVQVSPLANVRRQGAVCHCPAHEECQQTRLFKRTNLK